MSFWTWLFGKPDKKIFIPSKLGPAFQFIGNDKIKICEGELRDMIFQYEQELTAYQLRFFIKHNGSVMARAFCERNVHTGAIIYWDVMVEEKFRMKGIASMMTRYILRELITMQKKNKFMLRMIKLYRPTDKSIKLQNVGIGVIAHRLGLTCEFDLPRILNHKNILKIEILSPEGIFPPSYKIVLKEYPYVLIGFIIDPSSLKPITSYDAYMQMLHRQDIIEEWIRTKAIVIGNGNYILKKNGLNRFVSCIAYDEKEADYFRHRLVAG
jgi:hypothetical protein